VGVPVDESGDDKFAAGIDGLLGCDALRKCGGRILANGDDFVAPYGDETGWDPS
jgi:hypothetical protein